MNSRLIERLKVVQASVPVDITGAGSNGDWVSLKYFRRCLTIVQQGAWAGGTPALTFEQATDASGTGAKPLSYTERWNGTALTDDTYEKATVASDTSNLANAANGVVLVEHHSQDLDLANGFAYIRAKVASPGSNADLLSITYVLGDPAYECLPPAQPSAIS